MARKPTHGEIGAPSGSAGVEAAGSRAGESKRQRLYATTFGCELLTAVEPQALGLTYWFEAAPAGEPYSVIIRFTGHRVGSPGQADRFSVLETIEQVLPGSGRIAITTRVHGVAAGRWQISAAPVKQARRRSRRSTRAESTSQATLATASSSAVTGWAPLIAVRGPGVRLGAWPALVGLGVIIALLVQGRLIARAGLDSGLVLLLSLVASLVGLGGAKLYYLALHRGERRGLLTTGLCLQGFVLGAVGTLILEALAVGISLGRLLDLTTPGLLFAMAIGRIGCFLGGCCAGRPTASRWGLWSSDRRLATRRIPTQLLESALAGGLGVGALAAVLAATPHPAGILFVGTSAAYTLGRQLLFPLRDLPRKTARGRTIAIIATGMILAADIAVTALV